MEGVQFILHNPVYETIYTWGWSWEAFLLSLTTIPLIIIGYSAFRREHFCSYLVSGLLAIFVMIWSFVEFSSAKEIESYHHSEYVVIFHEDVDYKEFFEKYEIVSSDGEFYTIVEKDKIIEGE